MNGEHAVGPTRSEVEAKLLDLILGNCDRGAATDWAAAFIYQEARVDDRGVWEALVALSGADLPTTDRPYLHGEADFCVWLAELKRSEH